MTRFFLKHWFLLGLLIVLSLGLILGNVFSSNSQIIRSISTLDAGWITASILFLMAWSLDSGKILDSLRAPGPVIFSTLINMALLPVVSLLIIKMQLRTDLAIGLLVAIAAPSTMATASVFTRQAHGNDAVSLLVTLITNGLCVLITPFWLTVGATADFSLDATATNNLILRLVYTALIPSVLGQLCRVIPSLRNFVTQRKKNLSTIAQVGILILIFRSIVLNAEALLPKSSGNLILALLIVWIGCLILHTLGLTIGWWGGKWIGFSAKDRIGIAFSASQKTLAIPVLLVADIQAISPEALPLAIFPILVYHASQLLIDTMLIPHFSKHTSKNTSSKLS